MTDPYDPFEKYGMRRVINATISLTRLGGSIPRPEVFQAMEDASRAFIRIPVLQAWAGKKIAEATGAEAGLPTAGAANALVLAAAACIMKGTELEDYDPLKPQTWAHMAQRLPMHTDGLRTEFIVQGNNRNDYDHAVECAGGHMLEVGGEGGATEEELYEAYKPGETAAYYYTFRTFTKLLPLETVAKVAHDNGSPIIVDAAPCLTHKKVLRKLIDDGADLVIFSGGKHLGGLNNTGILAGRRDLIKLAHLQAYPFDGVGRGAKMSREVIVGLVKALELFMERDEEAHYRAMEEKARRMSERLGAIPGVVSGVTHDPPVFEGVDGTAYAYIELDDGAGMTLEELYLGLLEGDPVIETLYEPFFIIPDAEGKITVKPDYLLEGDEEIIVEKVRALLIPS